MGRWAGKRKGSQSASDRDPLVEKGYGKKKNINIIYERIISAIWKATSRLCSAFRRGSQVVR